MSDRSRPKDRKKYRSVKRDPVTLGIGDFTTAEMLCGLARMAFLQAVQDEVPAVLASLAEGPLASANDSVPLENRELGAEV